MSDRDPADELVLKLKKFEHDMAKDAISAFRRATVFLLASVVLITTGVILFFTQGSGTVGISYSFALIAGAFVVILFCIRLTHLAKLYERLDRAVLSLLACQSIPAVLEEIDFEQLNEIVSPPNGSNTPRAQLSVWSPDKELQHWILQPELPFKLRRLANSFEAVFAKVPTEQQNFRMPELEVPRIDTSSLTHEVERIRTAADELKRASTIEIPIFHGWQSVDIEVDGRSARSPESSYSLIVGQPAVLRVSIAAGSRPSQQVVQPLDMVGTVRVENIAFQLEIRSTGIDARPEMAVIEWTESDEAGTALIHLIPVAEESSSVFVNTYYGSSLLQTTRLQCLIDSI